MSEKKFEESNKIQKTQFTTSPIKPQALNKTSPLKNSTIKKRSRTYWDYKSQHNQDKILQSLGVNQKNIIQALKRDNNPYLQGASRKEKLIYKGDQSDTVSERLNSCWTIKRGKSTGDRYSQSNKQIKVSALPNIYQACKQADVVQDIIRESNIFANKTEMLQTLSKMKKQNLLNYNYKANVSSVGKKETIKYTYNDYHSRQSINGYSRTPLGTFYCN